MTTTPHLPAAARAAFDRGVQARNEGAPRDPESYVWGVDGRRTAAALDAWCDGYDAA